MKRIIALTVPFAVTILVVTAVAALEMRRGPDWQIELDEYMAYSALPSETVTIRSVVEAREPWNFSEGMGSAVRDDWRWASIDLPFPPHALRCALLERSREPTAGAEEGSRRQVVFVAYHTDALYRIGWVVHEGPQEPFPRELATHLAAIGCDLDLE